MFNEDQQAFLDYVNSIKCRKGEILLNAPAGTGKTHLAKHLSKIHSGMYFIAPTHKAKDLLKKEIKMVDTVHRFLCSVPDYKDNGDVEFNFNLAQVKVNDGIIVVDECSMIDDKMYAALNTLSKKNLVIYLGDDLQLPPIHKEEFNDEDPHNKLSRKSKTFDVVDKFSLTKNMRSERLVSTLMLNNARESLYSNKMPKPLLVKKIGDAIKDFIEQPTGEVIVLAYTNVCVNNYNKAIRSAIFNVKAEELDKYYPQEQLVFSGYRKVINPRCGCKTKCTADTFPRSRDCFTRDKIYHSNDKLVVDSITIKKVDIHYDKFTCNCPPAKIKKTVCSEHKIRKGSVELDFYAIIDHRGIGWYKPVNQKKFDKISKQYRAYNNAYPSSKRWKEYYRFMNLFDADINYIYASTIHKSQGAQWSKVYVDRSNVVNCLTKDQMLKLSCYYTAISRMKTDVYDIK